MFPPVEDKPGYVWISTCSCEMAKVDLIKERLGSVYEQYRILQEQLKTNNTQESCIPLCKGLQTSMVIIDDFLTKEKKE